MLRPVQIGLKNSYSGEDSYYNSGSNNLVPAYSAFVLYVSFSYYYTSNSCP